MQIDQAAKLLRKVKRPNLTRVTSIGHDAMDLLIKNGLL